jgi:hypothetical protein
MLAVGAIRPYLMPEGVERIAQHVMQMLEMAQASGRMRDAIKCIEILRSLMADNRQMAIEVDKVDRLDAGKPTAISGQLTSDAQERIKRIISTQRAINTEDRHGTEGAHPALGAGRGSGRGGVEPPAQDGGGEADPGRVDEDAQASRGDRGEAGAREEEA